MNRSGLNMMLLSGLTFPDNGVLLPHVQDVQEHIQDTQGHMRDTQGHFLVEVLSANIEVIRTHRDLTRAELCRLAGIRTSSLYNIEHCRSYARLDTIEKIARALDVPPAELLRP